MTQDITWVTTGEAVCKTAYSGDHLRKLARTGKVQARKVHNAIWEFDLQSLMEHRATSHPGPKKRTEQAR
jgi:hypothetical protein